MQRRRYWLAITVILLAVVTALLARRLPTTAPNLITVSTKVTDVDGQMSYWWLSNGQLLVKTTTNRNMNASAWSGYFELINTRTHTRVKLSGLASAIMRHVNGYFPNGPWGFRLSPDGKRLVWVRSGPRSHGQFPVTALMDGSEYCEWNALPGDLNDWIDADRFVSLFQRNHKQYAVVHSAAHRLADRVLPYSSVGAQTLLKQAGLGDDLTNQSTGSVGPVLGAAATKAGTEFRIEARKAQARPRTPVTPIDTVSFRSGTVVYFSVPNSQMTHIEFEVSDPQVPAYAALIHRVFPKYEVSEQPIERIFIYRIDKKVMYELGRINESSFGIPELNAAWLPDGKHLEYYYKNSVYTVNVD